MYFLFLKIKNKIFSNNNQFESQCPGDFMKYF